MGTEFESAPDVYEHDRLPWRPKPGCTSTFEEFAHARTDMVEIWGETCWIPDARRSSPQLERAEEVDDEWKRADPGWKPLTNRQMGARMAAISRRVKTDRKKREARWERDKDRCDSERERALLTPAENEATAAD